MIGVDKIIKDFRIDPSVRLFIFFILITSLSYSSSVSRCFPKTDKRFFLFIGLTI
jgi:hypothetical protein